MTKLVFLIQLPNNNANFTTASRYGELISILEKDEKPSLVPGPCMHKLKKFFDKEVRDQDYIVWAGGDPLALFQAGVAAAQSGVKTVTWLNWDKLKQKYIPVEVLINE